MSDIAIRVENLSKRYRIGEKQAQYTTLRDLLVEQARRFTQRRPRTDEDAGHFWALKDISFEVKQGEIVGVIGRNGAGKSTLLKILSRITEPTEGRVDLHGRVGSLLEVGTGFHPELTGRENIFLNGAILGMKRADIQRRFDEIVDFAEIERFLDTPVKHYSSGMYVRLAFAVAAHLETEILLVDEVLAVGDAEFQRKCLGKMGNVAKQGRTVAFISHNMAAVSNLCTNAIVLRNGKVVFNGDTDSAITHYLGSTPDGGRPQLELHREAWAKPWISRARLLGESGDEQTHFRLRACITIEMEFESPDRSSLRQPVMGVVINHLTWGTVAGVNTRMAGLLASAEPYDRATMRCTLKSVPLLQGTYTIDLWLGDGPTDIDCVNGYLKFTLEESDVYGSGQPPFRHMGIAILDPIFEIK